MTGRDAGGLEAVKWLAFGLMVLDHWTIFIMGERPGWAYLLGRLVFPLFAMALAHGLARSGSLGVESTARRMLVWAMIAQVPFSFLVPGAVLNVLFTFWAGLVIYGAFMFPRWNAWRVVVVGASVLFAGWYEFGPVGVALVVAAVGQARAQEHRKWWAAGFWIALTLLYGVNGSPWAMLAPLVFWGVVKWAELPRVKHAFYWLYPAQWVGLIVARAVL